MQDHATQSQTTGTLEIKGEGIQVKLEGDQDFLLRAWEALRPELLRRAGVRDPGAGQQEPQAPPSPATRPRLQITTCHDLYEKVYAVERGVAARGALGRFLDMSQVGQAWIEHPLPPQAEALLGETQALWSRLTRRGRRELGGGA